MEENKPIEENATVEENESSVKDDNKVNDFNEEEFLKKVEQAARKGAKSKGNWLQTIVEILPTLLTILMIFMIGARVKAFGNGISSLFHFDNGVQEHDQALDDNGFFGYTAADFENAILGDSEKLKKLEVFRQEVSDAVTITKTGLFNWKALSKTKLITYNGTVVYTVDLSTLTLNDIDINIGEKIITLKIPHAEQEEINIPEDAIQFGDTDRGLLAFGEMELTPEQNSEVQKEARKRMEEKLLADNIQATADRFAVLTVWEMYSPIIKGVARDYSLEVEFR